MAEKAKNRDDLRDRYEAVNADGEVAGVWYDRHSPLSKDERLAKVKEFRDRFYPGMRLRRVEFIKRERWIDE